jgi:hypothetical protein
MAGVAANKGDSQIGMHDCRLHMWRAKADEARGVAHGQVAIDNKCSAKNYWQNLPKPLGFDV